MILLPIFPALPFRNLFEYNSLTRLRKVFHRTLAPWLMLSDLLPQEVMQPERQP